VKRLRRWWLLGMLPVAGLCWFGLEPGGIARQLGARAPGVRDAWMSAGLDLLVGKPAQRPPAPSTRVRLSLDERAPLRVLDERFLSVAIDTSQLVGGRWWSPSGHVELGQGSERVAPLDLRNPELVRLAAALAPAYLRVGGTEADRVYYDLDANEHRSGSGAPPDEDPLDAPTWDALASFVSQAGLDLVFTVNAGPHARGLGGAWQRDNAEVLLRYARAHGPPVRVWELGNEVNAYWFMHGLRHQPSGQEYGADLIEFRRLVKEYFPNALVAGPGSAYFPRLGEPLPGSLDFLPRVLERAGNALDIVSWHYYPQQSRRCPIATRRARVGHVLDADELDEIEHWSSLVREQRDRLAPSAELWLGETGGAQCGGEPGFSDRFASGLWWLDELGKAALEGQAVVVRQTLIGSDYGLLNAGTLAPRPDYLNSLLWKHWMGPAVLGVRRSGNEPSLRTYAHCSPRQPGTAVLLALNVDRTRPVSFELGGGIARAVRFDFGAPALDSKALFWNGRPLSLAAPSASGSIFPDLEGQVVENPSEPLAIAPASYSFFELSGPIAAVCAKSKRELAGDDVAPEGSLRQ
jgi:heparanase 1